METTRVMACSCRNDYQDERYGKGMRVHNLTARILRPKFEVNVANALRAIAVFGGGQLIVVDPRYRLAAGVKGDRKPRPFRMKDYSSVVEISYCDMLSIPKPQSTVIVEKLEWATPLPGFTHPAEPLYIFGPEDGNVPKWIIERAKRHVFIPAIHCLNLACAVTVVLYDRMSKE